jgi:hypothetical protein
VISENFGIRHEHGVVLFYFVRNDLNSRISYHGTYYIAVVISKEHHNYISRCYVLYLLYSLELYLNTSINSHTLILNVSSVLKLGSMAYSQYGYSRKYSSYARPENTVLKSSHHTKITNQDSRCNQRCFCLTLLN